ncbi:helix-turn-helix transcriptional regulator [Galbibacter sp. BG1]|uniref:helix-turn-helix domain-containing protein n=1 Tax=Galbibacter sp. BG1 TaxID=1170699 RepID=UPI0015BE37B0|nr:AraC family transcriptional regulator [Galbibacter sp. BG1]QLE00133.1 helix-turn-helix transcriptional regulator [Galbibacter sp. BG1]
MKLRVKFDDKLVFRNLLKQQLDSLGVPYEILANLDIIIKDGTKVIEIGVLEQDLAKVGIVILSDEKIQLSERIKEVITEMIHHNNKTQRYKFSKYLSDKLNYSYSHLANVFSETTHTSIERFIILKKIDYAKTLMTNEGLTLTEIAYQLNYSSVAHLSNQFKKITGLSPSLFQEIVAKRNLERKFVQSVT